MIEILTSELMTPNPVTIPPDTQLMTALTMMSNRRYSCIIISEDSKPIGIITERDAVKLATRFQTEPELYDHPVSEVMTCPVVTISGKAHLLEALVLSRTHHIRHLLVVNQDENLIGLITQTDLTRAYFMIIEKQREHLEHAVSEETKALKEANEELKALSLEDPMLNIGNRRSLKIDLQYTHQMTGKHGRPYALMLIDVDYFKKYNDFYGHQKGDDVLKSVVDRIKESIRKDDRLYRYGGEEFLVLMPCTTAADAYFVSERVVKSVADMKMMHAQSPYKTITISAGVSFALVEDREKTWPEIIREADTHLYEAKRQGRNRAQQQGKQPVQQLQA